MITARSASGEIHLWLCFYDSIDDESLLHAYRELISKDERQQMARFYFEKDRKRYLVTRALVRTVLSEYVKIDPKDLRFSANAYGKPFLAGDDDRVRSVSFNLSHTHGMILLGIAFPGAIGVDAEHTAIRAAPFDIVDKVFASPEIAALQALPPERRAERFFQLWTLKESYIKARGMGLSLPLDKFGFHFDREGRVTLSLQAELEDAADRWLFWQLRPSADYLVSICVEHDPAVSRRIVARRTIPLAGAEPCSLPVLVSSPAVWTDPGPEWAV